MLPASVRIFVCTVPQDMRRSFDGLALAAKELLGEDPQSGAVFVFMGKRPSRIKVLWWDRNGYCLLSKRLHQAFFRLPSGAEGTQPRIRIDASAFASLLAGVQCDKKHTHRLTPSFH
jgi:transposase